MAGVGEEDVGLKSGEPAPRGHGDNHMGRLSGMDTGGGILAASSVG